MTLTCLGTGWVVIWDLQTGIRFDSFSGSSSQALHIWDVVWNPRPPSGSALVSGFLHVLGFPISEYLGSCAKMLAVSDSVGLTAILHAPLPSTEDQQSAGISGNVSEHESTTGTDITSNESNFSFTV